MKFIFSAGIILFFIKNNEREYLLLHYPHGHWDLPKGKIEEGETKQQAALRELKEETGIAAEIYPDFEKHFNYFFKLDDVLIKKTVYFFVSQSFTDQVTLSEEHIGYSWLKYKDALKRLTFGNAQEVLKKANQFLESRKNQ